MIGPDLKASDACKDKLWSMLVISAGGLNNGRVGYNFVYRITLVYKGPTVDYRRTVLS